MLILEESLFYADLYIKSRKIFEKTVLFIIPTLKLLDIFRVQISELDIIQLIPGLFYLFLFFFLLFLVFFSTISFSICLAIDNLKINGTKIFNSKTFFSKLKLSYTLISIICIFTLNLLFPLSLDTLINYGEKSLENSWSFFDILIFEITLIISLIFFTQFIIIFTSIISLERKYQTISSFWKIVVFLSILIAGIITPTLDINIQLILAIVSVFLYLITLIILQKRLNLKVSGFILFC